MIQPRLLHAVAALALLTIPPVTGAFRGPGPGSSTASSVNLPLPDLMALVDRGRIGSIDLERAKEAGAGIVEMSAASDSSARENLAAVFPDPSRLIAMLARDRDVDDFEESADLPGAAGDRYARIAALVPEMRSLRKAYEAVFAGAFESLVAAGLSTAPVQTHPEASRYRGGVSLPGDSSPPRRRDYLLSHTYALDIFFSGNEEMPFGGGEKGPLVFSPSEGIVVASASDWRGGGGLEAYRSGGITPNAGNGAVVYSPATGRYFLYFHLHSLLVTAGQAIVRGQPIGRIGDTGANARKPGHGGHLHLEIYDSAGARFLRHSEIAEMIF